MLNKRLRYALGTGGVLAILGAVQAQAGLSQVVGIVVERSMTFGFQQIVLRPGGSVVLENEDATAVHHPYIESEDATRDFGDQEPGSRTTMTFPDRGTFDVVCGIHPRMKLTVIVR